MKKKGYIIGVLLLIIVVILVGFGKKKSNNEESITKKISDYIDVQGYRGKDYNIFKKKYDGNYDIQFIDLYDNPNYKDFAVKRIYNYTEYDDYCNKWGLDKVYSDTSKNYIVFSYVSYGSGNLNAKLVYVDIDSTNIDLYVWDDTSGYTEDIAAYAIIVPVDELIETITIKEVYTKEEFSDIKLCGWKDCDEMTEDKPIIYLYPKEDTKLKVSLSSKDNITVSYPKYNDGWNVLAKKDGTIVDLDTNNKLYSLYYEARTITDFKVKNDGFVVKGEDSAEFLEDKLSILGLNYKEKEEFIVYWLPKLEANKYNYIRFATIDEINANMGLNFSVEPDSIIRVLMTFKGLDCPIEVKEQKLLSPKRTGFVAVEWGGVEIK